MKNVIHDERGGQNCKYCQYCQYCLTSSSIVYIFYTFLSRGFPEARTKIKRWRELRGHIMIFRIFGVFIHICCSIFRVNLLLWQITIWKGWAAMPMVVWWVTDLSRGPQPPPATAGPDPAKPGPTRDLSGHLHYKRGPGSTTPSAGRTLLLWPPRPITTVIEVHTILF